MKLSRLLSIALPALTPAIAGYVLVVGLHPDALSWFVAGTFAGIWAGALALWRGVSDWLAKERRRVETVP